LIAAARTGGAKALKLVTREMIKTMQRASVVVNIAIDQPVLA
jgi:alanine dehydrogenase